jgi:hypothetical protein
MELAVVIAARVLAVLAVLVLANFLPALYLKNPGMNTLLGEYVTVYYAREEAAAKDVFAFAEGESGRIAQRLGFTSPQNIKMYIYDTKSAFQIKKYGLATLLLNLSFFIGDNRGTNVLLTSPANPGKAHTYNRIKGAAIHEMVHAYNFILNPRMPLWINEGLALYLAGQNPRKDLYNTGRFPVPGVEQTHTKSSIAFSKMGGYSFAYTYVEFLDDAFGWNKVMAYAGTGGFVSAFGASEQDIYNGWIQFLKENYASEK